MKNNWKEVKLGDISTDVSYGYTESASDEIIGPKFLRITDIVPYFINWDTVPYCKITEIDFKKYKLKIGDIVIARTGATSGYNARITKDMNAVFASYLIRFRINENVADSKFISYILKSARYNNFIANSITGSAQPGINAKVLSSFTFKLPCEISEQKRIADILASFDDKIELLQKQNKTLEDMAKVIFKSWFVDFDIVKAKERKEKKSKILNEYKITEEIYNLFPDSFEDSELGKIPKGWEVKKLEDICDIFTGKKDVNQTVTNGKYIFFSCSPKTFLSNDFLYDGEAVIIAGNGSYTGRVAFYNGKFDLYQRTYGCVSKKEKIMPLIYMFMKYCFEPKYMGGTRGSSIPYIVKGDISYFLICYSKSIANAFCKIINDFMTKQQQNNKQIQTLIELRDILLPKLISGGIRV